MSTEMLFSSSYPRKPHELPLCISHPSITHSVALARNLLATVEVLFLYLKGSAVSIYIRVSWLVFFSSTALFPYFIFAVAKIIALNFPSYIAIAYYLFYKTWVPECVIKLLPSLALICLPSHNLWPLSLCTICYSYSHILWHLTPFLLSCFSDLILAILYE